MNNIHNNFVGKREFEQTRLRVVRQRDLVQNLRAKGHPTAEEVQILIGLEKMMIELVKFRETMLRNVFCHN